MFGTVTILEIGPVLDATLADAHVSHGGSIVSADLDRGGPAIVGVETRPSTLLDS